MVKTQIQVPEDQYQALRKFASEREWSMAETFRRGAELLLEVYPSHPSLTPQAWTPPSSTTAGWNGLDPAALKRCVEDDREPKPHN